MILFRNSLFRVEFEWIGTIILFFCLILSLSRPVSDWKESIMMIFHFLNFFTIFLEFPIPDRIWMDWKEKFFFPLILSWSRPVLALKEAILMFFNFLNFFAVFSEFYIPDWLGTNRNEFFFLSFSTYPVLFWLEKKP